MILYFISPLSRTNSIEFHYLITYDKPTDTQLQSICNTLVHELVEMYRIKSDNIVVNSDRL